MVSFTHTMQIQIKTRQKAIMQIILSITVVKPQKIQPALSRIMIARFNNNKGVLYCVMSIN